MSDHSYAVFLVYPNLDTLEVSIAMIGGLGSEEEAEFALNEGLISDPPPMFAIPAICRGNELEYLGCAMHERAPRVIVASIIEQLFDMEVDMSTEVPFEERRNLDSYSKRGRDTKRINGSLYSKYAFDPSKMPLN